MKRNRLALGMAGLLAVGTAAMLWIESDDPGLGARPVDVSPVRESDAVTAAPARVDPESPTTEIEPPIAPVPAVREAQPASLEPEPPPTDRSTVSSDGTPIGDYKLSVPFELLRDRSVRFDTASDGTSSRIVLDTRGRRVEPFFNHERKFRLRETIELVPPGARRVNLHVYQLLVTPTWTFHVDVGILDEDSFDLDVLDTLLARLGNWDLLSVPQKETLLGRLVAEFPTSETETSCPDCPMIEKTTLFRVTTAPDAQPLSVSVDATRHDALFVHGVADGTTHGK